MVTTRAGLAAALAMALATPAAADDFCGALKTAVADATRGFAAIRGQADPQYPASYWRPSILPGAAALMPSGSPCLVLHGAKTKPPDQYRCYFPGGATRDALLEDMRVIADRISGCLGPMAFDPAQGLWLLAQGGASVAVGGVLPNAGGSTVVVMISPTPPPEPKRAP
jgi:hypothetical protein